MPDERVAYESLFGFIEDQLGYGEKWSRKHVGMGKKMLARLEACDTMIFLDAGRYQSEGASFKSDSSSGPKIQMERPPVCCDTALIEIIPYISSSPCHSLYPASSNDQILHLLLEFHRFHQL